MPNSKANKSPTSPPAISRDLKLVPKDGFQLAPKDNVCSMHLEPICSSPFRITQHTSRNAHAQSSAVPTSHYRPLPDKCDIQSPHRETWQVLPSAQSAKDHATPIINQLGHKVARATEQHSLTSSGYCSRSAIQTDRKPAPAHV